MVEKVRLTFGPNPSPPRTGMQELSVCPPLWRRRPGVQQGASRLAFGVHWEVGGSAAGPAEEKQRPLVRHPPSRPPLGNQRQRGPARPCVGSRPSSSKSSSREREVGRVHDQARSSTLPLPSGLTRGGLPVVREGLSG
uniref:Uncharacterized protein n=1 Tax=Sphaerodactylus townsendi TaxID=933632 RepID=A0ACB8GA21_9SAUR